MKHKLLALALGVTIGLGVAAGPMPAVPAGPLYIKFDNREQIAIAPGATTGYANEINWGVLLVSSINQGNVTGLNNIEPTGGAFFNNISTSNGQITGIFYGIEGLPAGTGGNAFPATAGFLDLYYRDLDVFSTTDLSAALPSARTSQSTATGFTEGQLLVRLAFASGILDTSSSVFIAGSVFPISGTDFTGLATSYANVVDTTSDGVIDAADGSLAYKLNSDYFVTDYGTRDLRFRNIYQELSSWSDLANGIIGASSSDPATAFAVPEPGSLALVGFGLLGLAAMRRRRTF